MPVLPTIACQYFCDFVLLQIPKSLTPARKVLVQDIKAASIAQTFVTNLDWNNFVLSTYDFVDSWYVFQTFATTPVGIGSMQIEHTFIVS